MMQRYKISARFASFLPKIYRKICKYYPKTPVIAIKYFVVIICNLLIIKRFNAL